MATGLHQAAGAAFGRRPRLRAPGGTPDGPCRISRGIGPCKVTLGGEGVWAWPSPSRGGNFRGPRGFYPAAATGRMPSSLEGGIRPPCGPGDVPFRGVPCRPSFSPLRGPAGSVTLPATRRGSERGRPPVKKNEVFGRILGQERLKVDLGLAQIRVYTKCFAHFRTQTLKYKKCLAHWVVAFQLDEVLRKSMVFLLDWPAAFTYCTLRVSHNCAPALVYTAFPPKPRLSALAKRLVYTAFPPKRRLFSTPGTRISVKARHTG